jgi:hypothetical protein
MDLVQESCAQMANSASQAEKEIHETAEELRKFLEEQRATTENVLQVLRRLVSNGEPMQRQKVILGSAGLAAC